MYILILILALGWCARASAAGYGFDVGTPPAVYAKDLAQAGVTGRAGTWMRVRGLVEEKAVKADADRTVEGERAGLRSLRARGVKTMVILRWDRSSWAGGVRAGWGHRLPLDLREAFERGRWLGATYGDLVDGWEIDNEPDIDFCPDNPETYAAFLKAVYLGLKAGAKSLELGAKSSELGASSSNWLARKRGLGTAEVRSSQLQAHSSQLVEPLVILAPMALPPGPYFERFCANGVLNYSDGFNFHYYGYAEDFTGVYRQFEAAVPELGAKSCELGVRSCELAAKSSKLRAMPVFITEYGYGLMGADARNTVEGRVRQWQWFRNVIQQLHNLRPEGPMAFLVNPYYEAGINEFGLTMVEKPKFVAVEDRGTKNTMGGTPMPLKGKQLSFKPTDFGSQGAEPWMKRIGHRLGDHFASPALAYMWDFAERNPYRPRSWQVRSAAPSPVVVDFIADTDMSQWKSGGGYLLGGAERLTGAGKQLGGGGRVVLYNFSKEAIAGRLIITGVNTGQAVVLAAGERREIPVEFKVQAQQFVGEERRVSFIPDNTRWTRAEWVTRLFPDTAGMVTTPVRGFDFSEASNRSRAAALVKRPLAVGEPALQAHGRWLVTDGVRVVESAGQWSFHIDHLPAEALRPAMVELPLPVDFKIEPETMLLLDRRTVAASAQKGGARTLVEAARLNPAAGITGIMMDVYFRMENGNLYQTWPRLKVTGEWTSYAENMENFTMGFFGRAALPWRFSENRPVSLVFFLRAGEVPSVFEVKGAKIVRLGRQDKGP
ncbi:MAG: hypothetical protein H2172_13755 [Opitutus sp.]|nr:hypothetical protein [Opitutus sp.]MCS6273784.1 hypothetical protein [Opitutus sp.]MCS6277655.1 hypothetical protein [Opitutus sp.]MCS6300773.1 hypothetical protein [Opitutus sp.]